MGCLQASLGRAIGGRFTIPDNGRLARHLLRYEHALFVFLNHPGMEAANWPSEHVIRPAMVNRNSGGGNRSYRGAETQAVLMSLLRAAHQKKLDPRSLFTAILQAPTPAPEPLLLG